MEALGQPLTAEEAVREMGGVPRECVGKRKEAEKKSSTNRLTKMLRKCTRVFDACRPLC
jgi:hypothetical protein